MLRKIGEEAMRFLRGKYAYDEVGDGIDTLALKKGDETLVTIRIRDDGYLFLIAAEDGGEAEILVADMEALEAAKRLILAKAEPDRRPFPKERAVVSECGHRCDLCVHYTGGTIDENFRAELKARLTRVYRGDDWGEGMALCPGCANGGISGSCRQKECAAEKGAPMCRACGEYPCGESVAGYRRGIEPRSIAAEDVTWAILPYVDKQYGN